MLFRSEDSITNGSEDANSEVSLSGYKVFIDAPADVEVYVDGNYIGIAPISFPKVEGSIVVTLRLAGYQTRSYTLSIDGQEKDINYSFSSLLTIE